MSSNDDRISRLAAGQPRPELESHPDLRIQVRTKWLRQALEWARIAVHSKSPSKALRAVRLDADETQLTVTGFNYEHALSVAFSAKSGPLHVPGSTVIDAARLAAALDLIEGETVEITAAGTAATVMAPHCTVVLATVPVDDCPTPPRPDDRTDPGPQSVFTGEVLAAAARAAAIAELGPQTADRPAVRLSVGEEATRVWTTATFGATVQTVEHPAGHRAVAGLDVVVPAQAVEALAKSFAHIGGQWSVRTVTCRSRQWLELVHGQVTSRLKILATAVEELAAIEGYLAEAPELTATRTKKQLTAFVRAHKTDPVPLSGLVAAWTTDRTIKRRLLRSAVATLPDGEVALALTARGRLILSGERARTIASTARTR